MRKGKGRNSKLLPNSFRIISSCIRTVSTNASTAVRSAGASVAASISSGDDRKEQLWENKGRDVVGLNLGGRSSKPPLFPFVQVLWAGFDKLELSPTALRRVLLLGYLKGFQVFDVEDASGLHELVSRRDGPVTFLQMLPAPANSDVIGMYKSLYPIIVVVGGNEDERITAFRFSGQGSARNGSLDSSFGSALDPPTVVQFYSMKSNEYVKVLGFPSAVLMVRCSPRVVAVGLEEQVHCYDTLTLEKKFTVFTYPVPRVGEQGAFGINTGYGPMAVGPRWLAYPPNSPYPLNTGRVSPKRLASSGSPSTYPGRGTTMTRYAVESSKHLAAGLLTLGDAGYKKLSKYYPDLLSDSASSPGWKAGKLAASEPENAGVIAVKDLVSSEVISQFRAHTSPISALCFDPSGTLLVTASVHGNNMNIFRIMPFHKRGGSGSGDWSTSYAHLYKLHRGITSAVIQDICFSHHSQWIAIVSTRGTCHIFPLSPLGGNDGFLNRCTHGQGASLFRASNPPWWSMTSFNVTEQHCMPPSPCTLSVVVRIKYSDTGLLNSVSNAAASMAGKLWTPSGAVAAVFHNSNATGSLDVKSSGSSLEYILVYAPSGYVVQHEILSSTGLEPSDSWTESFSAPQANGQNEVKVEPIQWWDVCRRLDNMEREECISGSIFAVPNDPEIDDESKTVFQENAVAGEKKLVKTDSLKSGDKSHWYLSKAEVQINSSRFPIWQKSKMHFHVMEPPIRKAECCLGGEFKIEMSSSHEIEIRHKDLLPIFDNFPRAGSGWINRSEGKQPSASSNSCQAKEKTNEASIISHSKIPSFSSTESSGGGSSRSMENLLDLDHLSIHRSAVPFNHVANDLNAGREERSSLKVPSMNHVNGPIVHFPSGNTHDINFVAENGTISRSSSLGNEIQLLNANNTDSRTEGKEDSVQLFKGGYSNKEELDDHRRSTEIANDEIDSSVNSHEDEKPEEEKHEEEGWMGGMFDFSE